MKPPPPPLPPLVESLRKRTSNATRVAVLAAGSSLRGDDAAGMLAAEALGPSLKARPPRVEPRVFLGETVPENLTGEIKRFAPTHVIILDAADMGKEPGRIEIVETDALTHNPTAFTHNLPYSVLANYLKTFIRCDVFILGIQPASREFGAPVSDAVMKAVGEAADAVADALG